MTGVTPIRACALVLLGCLALAPWPDALAAPPVLQTHGNADRTVPPRIEVFANSAMAIAPYPGATIYWLDGLKLIESELSRGLPADEAQATAIARDRFKANERALRERSMNAVQGLYRSKGYRIDRVPAIVINSESVVYGTTDIAAAVRLYQATPGAHGPKAARPTVSSTKLVRP